MADERTIDLPEAPDWESTHDPETGMWHSVGREPGQVSLSVDAPGFVKKRTFIKPAKAYKHRILYGELDGVRVYIDGQSVILTKRDLYL